MRVAMAGVWDVMLFIILFYFIFISLERGMRLLEFVYHGNRNIEVLSTTVKLATLKNTLENSVIDSVICVQPSLH